MTITEDNTYSQGEQLQLSCSAEGGPELEYTWSFSDDIIDNVYTSMITIANLTTPNGGDYTCNVSNDAGFDSETITVYSKFFVCKFFMSQLLYCLMHMSSLNAPYCNKIWTFNFTGNYKISASY